MSNNSSNPLSTALKAPLTTTENSTIQKPIKPLETPPTIAISENLSAVSVVPAFLKEFFNQTELLLKSQTTYAKSHYFTNADEAKERVLIKERFLKKPTSVNCPKIHFATKFLLPTKGQLEQASNGLIYLKISEDFIDKLYPLIQEEGVIKPSDSIGAHIPVISPQEWTTLELNHFNQLKDVHSFSAFECQKHYIDDLPGIHSIWILTLKSPSLELLRENYRLPTKLHSQEFSVLFAIKPTLDDSLNKKQDLYYFRTNAATASYV